MATVVLASPLDDGEGTYATDADGALVAFDVVGWLDAPDTVVSVYEDTTAALLGTTVSSSTPDPVGGGLPGWYGWTITVTQWTSAGGALVPAFEASAAAGDVGLGGALAVDGVAAAAAGGTLEITAEEPSDIPASVARVSAGGVEREASLGVVAAAGAASAGTPDIAIAQGLDAAASAASAGDVGQTASAGVAGAAAAASTGYDVTDVTSPAISAFSHATGTDTDTSLEFTASATDNVAVTGWCIKDVADGASAPTATAGDCSQTAGISAGALSSATLSYTGTTGARDYYLFCRDAAGNVTRSSKVDVTISSGLDVSASFSRPGYSSVTTYSSTAWVANVDQEAWSCTVNGTTSANYPRTSSGNWTKVTGSYTPAQLSALASWSGTSTYNIGDVVRHEDTPSTTSMWRSLAGSNLNHFPQWSDSWWVEDNTLGGSFAAVGTLPTLYVSASNTLKTQTTAPSLVRWNATTGDNQAARGQAAANYGPAVRMSSTADTCYFAGIEFFADEGYGWTRYQIFRVVNGGTPAKIGELEAGEEDLESYVSLEVSGTTLVLKSGPSITGSWTTRVTVSNETTISSGQTGIRVNTTSGVAFATWAGLDL